MTMMPPPPTVYLRQPWLTLDLGSPHDIAGWPVVGPAWGAARTVTWLQVRDADLPRSVDPDAYFLHRARREGLPAEIGLMTAADISRFALERRSVAGGVVTVVVTAGLGNNESVLPSAGSVLTASHRVGTVNMVAVSPRPLSPSALLEAISIVAQGRTAAILDLCLRTEDGRPVTGTGTDCIVMAAPIGRLAQSHCGLHTSLGRALGEAAFTATLESCTHWLETRI